MNHQDHQAHQATSATREPLGALCGLGGLMNETAQLKSDASKKQRRFIPLETLEPRRLLHAGQLDPSFATAGIATLDLGPSITNVSSMLQTPDGGAILSLFNDDVHFPARVTPAGALDT